MGSRVHGQKRFGMTVCRLRTGFGVLLAAIGLISGCGYRVQNSVRNLPSGLRSLGIPTLKNSTAQYRIEQRMTSALLREFSTRTRAPVGSSATGVDAVLLGEIRQVFSNPVTYANDAFGSAFVVTVHVAVKLVRSRDSAILWEASDFLFTERYVLNSKVSNFFSEEGPALDRLSQEFAASLASTILSR